MIVNNTNYSELVLFWGWCSNLDSEVKRITLDIKHHILFIKEDNKPKTVLSWLFCHLIWLSRLYLKYLRVFCFPSNLVTFHYQNIKSVDFCKEALKPKCKIVQVIRKLSAYKLLWCVAEEKTKFLRNEA